MISGSGPSPGLQLDGALPSPSSSRTSWTTGSGSGSSKAPFSRGTTVVLRDVPIVYTRRKLLEVLDAEGFQGKYDFVFLPIDCPSFYNIGIAHINLTTEEYAWQFLQHFNGFADWGIDCPKVASTRWSRCQGFDSLIELYRDQGVMHCSVPEYCRPAVFHKGEQVALPEPAGLPARGGAGATTAALRGARRAASASEPWRPLAAATTDDFEKDSMLSDTTLLAGLQASGDSRHCKTEQGARSHRTWSRLLGLRRGPGG